MNNLKIVSILALVLSVISMILGIDVVCYYVDDPVIRGLSIFILIMSSTFVSRTVALISREIK